jgi:hypothetical protein
MLDLSLLILLCLVCDPTTQTPIQTLENVQRIAARFVINDYTSRTPGCMTSMLTSLEWQILEQRRRISRLVMMYMGLLVGMANLLSEVSSELLYGAGPNCGVW